MERNWGEYWHFVIDMFVGAIVSIIVFYFEG